ncbi:MAG: hypothetical protein FJ110_02725 [Deltaproteobacteria bacterium]|nr:hypothetical protein [Deltaproteobacteria bacterium]
MQSISKTKKTAGHGVFSLLTLSLIFSLLIISFSHYLIISEAWSATYYVDATNGNDAGRGLKNLPKTFSLLQRDAVYRLTRS